MPRINRNRVNDILRLTRCLSFPDQQGYEAALRYRAGRKRFDRRRKPVLSRFVVNVIGHHQGDQNIGIKQLSSFLVLQGADVLRSNDRAKTYHRQTRPRTLMYLDRLAVTQSAAYEISDGFA